MARNDHARGEFTAAAHDQHRASSAATQKTIGPRPSTRIPCEARLREEVVDSLLELLIFELGKKLYLVPKPQANYRFSHGIFHRGSAKAFGSPQPPLRECSRQSRVVAD